MKPDQEGLIPRPAVCAPFSHRTILRGVALLLALGMISSPAPSRASRGDDPVGLVAQALQPARKGARPEPLPEALRADLSAFLERLKAAVASRRFAQLAPLLDPAGVEIEGLLFADAAHSPQVQKPQVVPLWYATDVSLTLGTAWELLINSANPPPVTLGFDATQEKWRVLSPGEKSDTTVTAEKQQGVLPMHLRALALAPEAQLVPDYPQELAEFEDYREDATSQPFMWVYRTAPSRYRLEQLKGIGLILDVVQLPGQGLRLRGVATQSP